MQNYILHGDDLQALELVLGPNDSVIAQTGALTCLQGGVHYEAKLGDGSPSNRGFVKTLLGLGKRALARETLFLAHFRNDTPHPKSVVFGAPYAGKIIPLNLAAFGGSILCQKEAFLCAQHGTHISVALQRRIRAGVFGGEGFVLQRLVGDTTAFLHAGGCVIERDLKAGEVLNVEAGCLVAFEESVDYSIAPAGGVKTMVFGGEGLFFASLTGPGKVFVQTLPLSKTFQALLFSMKSQRQSVQGSQT